MIDNIRSTYLFNLHENTFSIADGEETTAVEKQLNSKLDSLLSGGQTEVVTIHRH